MKTHRISIVVTVCVVFILTATSNVQGTITGIEVLSENYHVWGDIYVYNGKTNEIYYDQYDEASSSPISREVSYRYPPDEGRSVWSASAGDLFSINISTNAFMGSAYSAAGGANVDATWTFRPLTDSITLTALWNEFLYQSTYTQIWLTDLTAGLEMAYTYSPNYDTTDWLMWSYTDEYGPVDYITLPVDLAHNYSIRMTSRSEAQDDGWFSNVNVIITPEPATLLLLGLGGMILRRRAN